MTSFLRMALAFTMTAAFAAPVLARDDGPRFPQDRLDALVAAHREAARHIPHTAPKDASEAH